jgi:hypothetical protein
MRFRCDSIIRDAIPTRFDATRRRRQATLIAQIEELAKKPASHPAPTAGPVAPSTGTKRPRDDGPDGHFRRDARPPPASACVLCLGRASAHPEGLPKCRPDRFWDNSGPTFCERNERGDMVRRSDGRTPICFNFNRGVCSSKSHPERHLCSGCGSNRHNAQGCALAQKA